MKQGVENMPGMRTADRPKTGAQKWALQGDSVSEVAWIGALFVVFFLANRLTVAASSLTFGDIGETSLVVTAVQRNVFAASLLVLVLGGIALVGIVLGGRGAAGRWRFFGSWDDLEHGAALQAIAAVLVAMVAWRLSTYSFNFFAEQWHWADRALIVVLAVAVLVRPMFLVPFVLVARVIGEQFGQVAGLSSTENITKLLLVVLLAIAAMHLIYTLSGDRRTSMVWLLIAAAMAAQFFRPGIGKVRLGWLFDNHLDNFARAGHTAGWRGAGDGEWADRIVDAVRPLGWGIGAATLLVELGAIVAALHYRMLRLWLPAVIGFHIATFAFTGFFFGEWIVLEVALLLALTRPGSHRWFEPNITPARIAIVFLAVAFAGTQLFQAPALAWFDSDVGYGYTVEATLNGGERVNVPLGAFAPFEQDLAFAELQFTEFPAASSGYGSVFSADRRVALEQVASFDELIEFEKQLEPVPMLDQTIAAGFVLKWIDYANSDPDRPAWLVAPPSYFWTSVPDPTFAFGDHIASLEVTRVRSIHRDEPLVLREVVLRAGLDVDGNAVVLPLDG